MFVDALSPGGPSNRWIEVFAHAGAEHKSVSVSVGAVISNNSKWEQRYYNIELYVEVARFVV